MLLMKRIKREVDIYLGDKARKMEELEASGKLYTFAFYVIDAAMIYFILQVMRSFFYV